MSKLSFSCYHEIYEKCVNSLQLHEIHFKIDFLDIIWWLLAYCLIKIIAVGIGLNKWRKKLNWNIHKNVLAHYGSFRSTSILHFMNKWYPEAFWIGRCLIFAVVCCICCRNFVTKGHRILHHQLATFIVASVLIIAVHCTLRLFTMTWPRWIMEPTLKYHANGCWRFINGLLIINC